MAKVQVKVQTQVRGGGGGGGGGMQHCPAKQDQETPYQGVSRLMLVPLASVSFGCHIQTSGFGVVVHTTGRCLGKHHTV